MNKTYAGGSPRPGGKRPLTIAGILGAIALISYALVQPHLNERYGWNLPALTERPSDAIDGPAGTQTADQIVTNDAASQTAPATGEPPANQTLPSLRETPPTAESAPPATSSDVADSRPTPVDEQTLRYGFLRPLGNDRFISPAGLQYLPGSQEGHRLAHLQRHTADQPNRPGSHGVFDGGMEAVVRVLDEAYLKAKQDAAGVTTQQDQDRTIYTVNMGKRIGYVGGREGNRRRKPMARRVRLVLEGTRVITAYPL